MPLEFDEAWRKLQPKVRRGDCSANLSQMSSGSSFSRNSILSLPKKSVQSSPKVTSEPVSPPISLGSQTPKRSSGTPNTSTTRGSSVTFRTPKSANRHKSSPRSRKTPYKGTPDGLKQSVLESFYHVESVGNVETPKNKENIIIEISSDEDQVDDEKSRTDNLHGKGAANVSRVLFPDSSSSSLREARVETNTKIIASNVLNGKFKFKEPKSLTLINSNGAHNNHCNVWKPKLESNILPSEAPTIEERLGNYNVAPCTSQLPVAEKIPQGSSKKMENTCNNIDKDWLTQEGEASKKYAANQWRSLMQKMRNGQKSFESSSSVSTPAFSSMESGPATQDSYDPSGESSGYSYTSGQRTCPFYKRIEGTKFAVDAFSYGSIKGISHYFLSHFHYDHYMGLRKNFSHPIYCSSVTAKLVASKIGVDDSLLRRIDPGQTTVVDGIKITALDANHCPGSVMLLFELPNGKTHLHVGDFRANLYMESYHALWNVDIDCLHLDTTYCDPTYKFPSQERVIENVSTIVEEALRKDSKTLIVSGSYTIGKERVFAALSKRFNFKVWAPPEKRRIFDCLKKGLMELSQLSQECASVSEGGAARELDLLDVLSRVSSVKEDAQIHVLSMAKIKKECLLDHMYSMKGSKFTNVVAFRPTGWAQGRTKGKSESSLVLNLPTVKIYEVPYSEHSSFSELERFVKFIRPKRVIKTVNVGNPKSRAAMEVHINAWLKENRLKVPLPSKNADSPKSSLATAEQKQAGVFEASKGRHGHHRLITTPFKTIYSQDNNRLAIANGSGLPSRNVSFNSQHVEFSNGQVDNGNISRTPNMAVKRAGSPTGGPFLKKMCIC